MFERGGKEVLIELTTAGRGLNRSSIKSMEVQSRLYHGIKNHLKNNSKMVLVLDKSWKKTPWLVKEEDFLKDRGVFLTYFDFEAKNWAENAASEINSLMNQKGIF